MPGLIRESLGPLFVKEMLEISRQRRWYAIRTAYGLVLLFAMFVAWNQPRQGSGMQQMTELAGQLFTTVAMFQYVAIFVLVPPMTAGLIVNERVEGSLDLLLTTPLSDREIILGKLASRLALMLLIVASAFPVLALAMLFGGIDPVRLLTVETTHVLATLFVGMVGVWSSTVRASSTGAVASAFVYAVVVFGMAFFMSPHLAMALAWSCQMGDQVTLVLWGLSWFFPLCVIVILLVDATAQLRLKPLPINLAATPVDTVSLTPHRGRTDRWGRPAWRFNVSSNVYELSFVAIVGLFFSALMPMPVPMCLYLSLAGWIGLAGLAISLASGRTAVGKRREFWMLVLGTPLQPSEIYGAMLRASIAPMWWFYGFVVFLSCCSVIVAPLPVVLVIIIGTLFLALVLTMGTTLSLLARTPLEAALPMWGFAAIVFAVPFLFEPWSNVANQRRNTSLFISLLLAHETWFAFSLLLAIGTWIGLRRRCNARLAAFHFAAVYACLVFGPQLLAYDRGHTVLWRLSPAFWIGSTLIGETLYIALPANLLYCFSVILTIAYIRGFAIRNFDRLTGRVVQQHVSSASLALDTA